ncbi:hypothetical protein N0V84_001483 [Fusarium piperis]|uniref:Major facilitator superfamily (MFS) profile domain-containing protein n=1 Tax=Fusarium piperis TaxID=1435070 RepID=A0A9W9BTA6_9HYPO|nr:hypothetical protein N0V84_001483 [Fusarium piperis]
MSSLKEPYGSHRDSLHAAGSVFFVSSAGRVLKLPIPSTSHRDPLTWRPSKRTLAFIALLFYSVVASVEANLPGLLMLAIKDEFGDRNIQPLASAMTLFTGLGYLFSIPLSTAIGRRPVLLCAATITSISTFWAGLVGGFDELIVALCFQALAVGTSVGMCTLIIIDATFIHERPNALSLFWCVGSTFIKLGTLILPFMADICTNWRSIYHVWSAPCLVALALAIFLVPETYFERPPVALDGRVLVQSSSEKVRVYDDWEDVESYGSERPLPDVPLKRNFWSRFGISRAPGTNFKAMGATYMQMVLCILNPLTFWVALLTGVILSGVIFLNITQPAALAGPVPSEDSRSHGVFIGVAGIIGSILAFPASGPLASWFTRYYALRSGGMRHAEIYLPAFAMPVVSGLVSVILNGVAINNDWESVWLYVASGISIFSYLTGNVAFTLWITEAFPRWAAAALAVQLFTGHMVSFGIGSAIMGWCHNKQIMAPTMLIGGLILFLGALAVPVAFWGKTVRQYIDGRWSESEKGALRPQ